MENISNKEKLNKHFIYRIFNFFEGFKKKPIFLLPFIILMIINVLNSFVISSTLIDTGLIEEIRNIKEYNSFYENNKNIIIYVGMISSALSFLFSIIILSILFYFIASLFVQDINIRSVSSMIVLVHIPNGVLTFLTTIYILFTHNVSFIVNKENITFFLIQSFVHILSSVLWGIIIYTLTKINKFIILGICLIIYILKMIL